MEYRWLGHCGVRVSELCLGTMTFGHGTDKPTAKEMVHMALDQGVTFLDTANSYSAGQSEEFLSAALGNLRKNVVIATKLANPMGPGPNQAGTSRIYIMDQVEESLRRLETDWIDLLYIHHVDDHTPEEEKLRALDDLVRQGKVRYIAVSNYEGWRLCDALWTSESGHLESYVCYQGCYSLVVRNLERDVFEVCRRRGLGLVPFGVVADGFLTGKYKPGQRVLEGTRSEEGWVFLSSMFAPNADETLEAVLQTAEEMGCHPAQVAISWVLGRPGVSSTLIGARTVEQLETNLAAVDVKLEKETRERLDEVSAQPSPYPKAMAEFYAARRSDALKPSPLG